jgi:hypothetical protein
VTRRWLTPSAILLVLTTLGVATGGVLWFAGQDSAALWAWTLTTGLGLVTIGWEVLHGIARRQPGVDLIAFLAMAGALALEEYLAGCVIAFMLATGRALEHFGHLLSDLPPEGPSPEDLVDLRRVLYGLHAILRLHFAQEEEAYAWLSADAEEKERVAAG